MREAEVSFIACSDIHLSEKAPVARSAEPDWLGVQARYLRQLSDAASFHGVPVVIAGDIFDRYNPSPTLINFALKHLPKCYAVPGQHDLPNHCYEDIGKSAYWTLVEAGKIVDLKHKEPLEVGNIRLHGFPFGCELEAPVVPPHTLLTEIAVVHRYVWMGTHCYEGADQKYRVKKTLPMLRGYDVAVFGDNHKGFCHQKSDTTIINCGGFVRRKSDEKEYMPSFYLVYGDWKITVEHLKTTGDKFLADEELLEVLGEVKMTGLLRELEALGDAVCNFNEVVKRILEQKKVSEGARRMVIQALEGVGK